jgi:hypothetical protein
VEGKFQEYFLFLVAEMEQIANTDPQTENRASRNETKKQRNARLR